MFSVFFRLGRLKRSVSLLLLAFEECCFLTNSWHYFQKFVLSVLSNIYVFFFFPLEKIVTNDLCVLFTALLVIFLSLLNSLYVE